MEIRRSEKIAEAIEQLVFSGEFPNGARLDELRLADRFNVSRTPIREALQVLVSSGMAEQIPRRGVFVRQPGPVELMEMFETMAEMEASCGRMAATRMTDAGLERLESANAACEEAIRSGNHNRYYAANETFHKTIYRGSANGFLEQRALKLQNRLKPYRKIQLRFRGRMEQSLAEHREIVDAIVSGNAERAAVCLRNHVTVQGEKFHNLIAGLNQ